MGNAFLHGFGAAGGSISNNGALNFVVVGGTVQPSEAAENTIWVNTEAEITGYVFDIQEPAAPEEGMVWIYTGNSSAVAFNALKEDTIQLYPISCKQYVSGAWADKTAMSYLDGAWVEWIKWGVLYEAGNQNTALTGGWTNTPTGLGSDSNVKGTGGITEGADTITFQNTKTGGVIYHTANKVDLTDFSTVTFDGVMTRNSTGNVLYFSVWTDLGTYFTTNRVANLKLESNKDGEVTLDISEVTGECYVGFGLYSNSPEVVMRSLKLT